MAIIKMHRFGFFSIITSSACRRRVRGSIYMFDIIYDFFRIEFSLISLIRFDNLKIVSKMAVISNDILLFVLRCQ